MSHVSISHDDAIEALGAAALNALDAGERDAVMAHVASCDACARELARLRDAAASLASLVPADAMSGARSDRVRARLVARARAERGGSPIVVSEPVVSSAQILTPARGGAELALLRGGVPEPGGHGRVTPPEPSAPVLLRPPGEDIVGKGADRRWALEHWLSRAAVIGFIAALAGLGMMANSKSQLANEHDRDEQRIEDLKTELAMRDRAIADKDRALAAIAGPRVAMMNLSAGAGKPMAGKMFWDRSTNSWTLYAYNMPMPRSGKTYQVWLMVGSNKVSAGTFMPSPKGDGSMTAQFDPASANVRGVAVTEEPMGGMPQPTGPMVLSTS